MVVGEHSRDNDLTDVVREKKLTNVRAAGKDDATTLAPPTSNAIGAMPRVDSGRRDGRGYPRGYSNSKARLGASPTIKARIT